MRQRHVDVTMGSPRFRSLPAGSCEIVQAWFPANTVLPPHTHGRSVFAIMLAGSFTTSFGARHLDCTPGTVWTEPLGERHANHAGKRGARVLVIQADPNAEELTSLQSSLFAAVAVSRHPQLAHDARRMAAEFQAGDCLSDFMLEALAFGMFVSFLRARREDQHASPSWLARVRDCLHEEFVRPPTLSRIARDAGVHPTHLCHEFRSRMGMTIGDYLRSVRLDWAMSRLIQTTEPISAIALAAGYADQAHFTRACRAATGTPPATYRRLHGVAQGDRSRS